MAAKQPRSKAAPGKSKSAAAGKKQNKVTVSRPPRALNKPPALGDDEVEVSGVYGTVRYKEGDPLAEVKEIFGHYDRNGSGTIEAKEFARILEALGMELEEHELKVAILDVDHDGDGKISWEEFSDWWRAMRS